jgi:hypothetical protein
MQILQSECNFSQKGGLASVNMLACITSGHLTSLLSIPQTAWQTLAGLMSPNIFCCLGILNLQDSLNLPNSTNLPTVAKLISLKS